MKVEFCCIFGYIELDDDEEGGVDVILMFWCYYYNVIVYGWNKCFVEVIVSLKDKVIRECLFIDIIEDVIECLLSCCWRYLRWKVCEEDVGFDFFKLGIIILIGFFIDVIKMYIEVMKVL